MKIWYDKAIESLEIGEPSAQQTVEYQPTFHNGEQRKFYRDDVSPLTDEERKILQDSVDNIKYIQILIAAAALLIIGFLFFYFRDDFTAAFQFSSIIFIGAVLISVFFWYSAMNEKSELKANKKRIIIASVSQLSKVSTGVRGNAKSYQFNIITWLDTKDRVREELSKNRVDWVERDMVEMHYIFRPNNSRRVALAPTKVLTFKRQKIRVKDASPIFLKDEIVPLTDEDKIKIAQNGNAERGCVLFLALLLAAIGGFIFFYVNAELTWRLIFGGVCAVFSALLVLGWTVSKSEDKKEIAADKKRIVAAAVVETFKKTILGKPTEFYAELRTVTGNFTQKIPPETYAELQIGDIISFELSENPTGKPTVLKDFAIAAALPNG